MLSMPTDDDTEAATAELLAEIATVARYRQGLETELRATQHKLEALWADAVAAGVSFRRIGDASGVDHTTVYRTINPRPKKGDES